MNRRLLLIIIASVIGVLFLCSVIGGLTGMFNTNSNASSPPTATATTAPTKAPVAQPLLGSPINDFIAKYGQPTMQGTGGYLFQSGSLTVTTQPKESPSALAIVLSTNSSWNEPQAIQACSVFLPTDAAYTGVGKISSNNAGTGKERLYFSASLARKFPASEFVDSNLNSTKLGTFAIILNYNGSDTMSFSSCAIQLQLE